MYRKTARRGDSEVVQGSRMQESKIRSTRQLIQATNDLSKKKEDGEHRLGGEGRAVLER